MEKIPTSKDYWPDLLRLADEQGRIEDPTGKKGIAGYLRVKLGLSTPTIRSLLDEWAKEGRIRLEKGALNKDPVRVQILSPKKEEIKPSIEETKLQGRGVVLIDWENLLQSLGPPTSGELSVSQIFLKLIKKIGQEIGEIVSVFVFAPPHLASEWGETFHEKGFFVISCPKVTDKKGEERDTVDETLIDFGGKVIQNMNLSYLCVGTGDRDFSKLYLQAIGKGLKAVTVAASEKSLSSKLIPLSDKIIILSTLKKGQE